MKQYNSTGNSRKTQRSTVDTYLHASPTGRRHSRQRIRYQIRDAGKRGILPCADDIPSRLQYISKAPFESCPDDFEPDLITAVDAASPGLLGRFGDGL